MQNGTVNGVSHQDEPVAPKPDASSNGQSVPEQPPDPATLDSIPSEPKNDEVATIHPECPPSKKRKLAGGATPRRSLSRAPSPPWKKAGVDGPTTFIQDGRRKSSRVNTAATEMQPPSEKRSIRESQKPITSKNGTGGGRTATSSPSLSERSGKGRGGKASANGSPVTLGTTKGTGGRKKRVSQSPVPKQSHSRTRSRSSGFHHPLSESVNGSSPNASRSYQSPSITNVAAVGGIDDFEIGPGDGEQAQDDETGQRVPRLRIKVKKPFLGVQHPSHVLPPRKYGSFRDWMNSEDGKMKDDGILTPAGAVEEAERRRQVQEAAEPGGLLSAEVCSAYIPEQQEELPQQYSHQDHLVAHALYFKKLLDQEHRRHRHTAKLFAQWCADAWRKRNKDPEDVLREQQEEMRGKRKQLAKDLQKMFDLARAEVDRMRLARWEEERKVEDQQALDRAIKQSTMLFEKRRQEILGETGSDMPESSEGEEGETDDSEDGEDNMSSDSDSDSEDGANGVDDDEGLTAEELRMKYSNLPQTRASVESESAETASSDQIAGDSGLPPEQLEVEDVDPMLMDDSEASTDMDDDMGDSDGNQESDNGSEEEEEDDGPGLLGFFAPKDVELDGHDDDVNVDDDGHALANDFEEDEDEEEEEEPEDTDEVFLVPNNAPAEPEAIFQDVIPHDDEHPPSITEPTKEPETIPNPESVSESRPDASPAPEQEPELTQIDMGDATRADNETPALEPEQIDSMEMDGDDHQHLEARRPSREVSSQASPGTLATKPSEPESVSSYDAPPATAENEEEKALQVTGSDGSPTPGVMKTPLPHLIRGDLREYQHFGLDWLAGLYSNHINGILADEMGLGKTIQTIALLAHLALEKEVWGPHLVVVPTSVILNWEMEFKKWCPGFKIMTYYGNQEERRQKRKGWMDDTSWNVLITSYQLVLQDQQVLKRRAWHYMILDEAHNIKNFRSQRWQALLTFRTRARLLLTGTPLQNNLTELWSLLFFLMPSDVGEESGIEGFADLRNFSEWFRRPVEQILEHGRETMDEEAKQVVTKLHTVLRPYILRRLKADVEKQMPGKYEHVVYCRLSKRQRFLYDGFMSRAQTKETLETGNYLSIINCLMQLRKVCNHPDLFETRQISTSFAMHKSVATEYEIKDFLVRRRLLFEHPLDKLDLDFLNLVPISRENISRRLADDSTRLMAYGPFNKLRERQYNRTNWQMGFDGSTMQSTLDSLENDCRKRRMAELERCLYFESKRHGRRPVYGSSLIEFLTADSKDRPTSNGPLRKQSLADWLSNRSSVLASMILSVEERSQAMEGYVQRFACVTPAAVAAGITEAALTPIESRSLTKKERLPPFDPFHEAQMRLSIAFPDKRLLQYDCGKLQRLDKLLRDLKAGGHRALIFTQMTKMLDILEQFLNIHGHRYLRLDGTTKVEQRQILTDRFNNDDRILAFILSSRSGGLGINLTGADAVIFYDLDWNPAMDKQCQDRCHRIGQTRDVHIYRFVSEYTIESNILRKANQKRMLDDVVIQEGEFNTDYMTKLDPREMFGQDDALDGHQDAATAAMDRVLETRVSGGGGSAGAGGTSRVFEQAEDKEDIDAAKNAQKELEHADQDDFEDRSIPGRPTAQATTGPEGDGTTPGAQLVTTPQVHGTEDEAGVESQPGDIDEYLIRFMEWNMKDEPLVLPADKSKKKSKKGKEHRLKRRR